MWAQDPENTQSGDSSMSTNCKTNRSETALRNETISDETLDHAVGGINPQPLPPRDPEPQGMAKAGRAFTIG
jgi:hypothetical protein